MDLTDACKSLIQQAPLQKCDPIRAPLQRKVHPIHELRTQIIIFKS
jgi:hypothetical protein